MGFITVPDGSVAVESLIWSGTFGTVFKGRRYLGGNDATAAGPGDDGNDGATTATPQSTPHRSVALKRFQCSYSTVSQDLLREISATSSMCRLQQQLVAMAVEEERSRAEEVYWLHAMLQEQRAWSALARQKSQSAGGGGQGGVKPMVVPWRLRERCVLRRRTSHALLSMFTAPPSPPPMLSPEKSQSNSTSSPSSAPPITPIRGGLFTSSCEVSVLPMIADPVTQVLRNGTVFLETEFIEAPTLFDLATLFSWIRQQLTFVLRVQKEAQRALLSLQRDSTAGVTSPSHRGGGGGANFVNVQLCVDDLGRQYWSAEEITEYRHQIFASLETLTRQQRRADPPIFMRFRNKPMKRGGGGETSGSETPLHRPTPPGSISAMADGSTTHYPSTPGGAARWMPLFDFNVNKVQAEIDEIFVGMISSVLLTASICHEAGWVHRDWKLENVMMRGWTWEPPTPSSPVPSVAAAPFGSNGPPAPSFAAAGGNSSGATTAPAPSYHPDRDDSHKTVERNLRSWVLEQLREKALRGDDDDSAADGSHQRQRHGAPGPSDPSLDFEAILRAVNPTAGGTAAAAAGWHQSDRHDTSSSFAVPRLGATLIDFGASKPHAAVAPTGQEHFHGWSRFLYHSTLRSPELLFGVGDAPPVDASSDHFLEDEMADDEELVEEILLRATQDPSSGSGSPGSVDVGMGGAGGNKGAQQTLLGNPHGQSTEALLSGSMKGPESGSTSARSPRFAEGGGAVNRTRRLSRKGGTTPNLSSLVPPLSGPTTTTASPASPLLTSPCSPQGPVFQEATLTANAAVLSTPPSSHWQVAETWAIGAMMFSLASDAELFSDSWFDEEENDDDGHLAHDDDDELDDGDDEDDDDYDHLGVDHSGGVSGVHGGGNGNVNDDHHHHGSRRRKRKHESKNDVLELMQHVKEQVLLIRQKSVKVATEAAVNVMVTAASMSASWGSDSMMPNSSMLMVGSGRWNNNRSNDPAAASTKQAESQATVVATAVTAPTVELITSVPSFPRISKLNGLATMKEDDLCCLSVLHSMAMEFGVDMIFGALPSMAAGNDHHPHDGGAGSDGRASSPSRGSVVSATSDTSATRAGGGGGNKKMTPTYVSFPTDRFEILKQTWLQVPSMGMQVRQLQQQQMNKNKNKNGVAIPGSKDPSVDGGGGAAGMSSSVRGERSNSGNTSHFADMKEKYPRTTAILQLLLTLSPEFRPTPSEALEGWMSGLNRFDEFDLRRRIQADYDDEVALRDRRWEQGGTSEDEPVVGRRKPHHRDGRQGTKKSAASPGSRSKMQGLGVAGVSDTVARNRYGGEAALRCWRFLRAELQTPSKGHEDYGEIPPAAASLAVPDASTVIVSPTSRSASFGGGDMDDASEGAGDRADLGDQQDEGNTEDAFMAALPAEIQQLLSGSRSTIVLEDLALLAPNRFKLCELQALGVSTDTRAGRMVLAQRFMKHPHQQRSSSSQAPTRSLNPWMMPQGTAPSQDDTTSTGLEWVLRHIQRHLPPPTAHGSHHHPHAHHFPNDGLLQAIPSLSFGVAAPVAYHHDAAANGGPSAALNEMIQPLLDALLFGSASLEPPLPRSSTSPTSAGAINLTVTPKGVPFAPFVSQDGTTVVSCLALIIGNEVWKLYQQRCEVVRSTVARHDTTFLLRLLVLRWTEPLVCTFCDQPQQRRQALHVFGSNNYGSGDERATMTPEQEQVAQRLFYERMLINLTDYLLSQIVVAPTSSSSSPLFPVVIPSPLWPAEYLKSVTEKCRLEFQSIIPQLVGTDTDGGRSASTTSEPTAAGAAAALKWRELQLQRMEWVVCAFMVHKFITDTYLDEDPTVDSSRQPTLVEEWIDRAVLSNPATLFQHPQGHQNGKTATTTTNSGNSKLQRHISFRSLLSWIKLTELDILRSGAWDAMWSACSSSLLALKSGNARLQMFREPMVVALPVVPEGRGEVTAGALTLDPERPTTIADGWKVHKEDVKPPAGGAVPTVCRDRQVLIARRRYRHFLLSDAAEYAAWLLLVKLRFGKTTTA